MNKDTELKQARNLEIYRRYVEGLEAGRVENMRSAADYILQQKAPQFYISSHTASLIIGKIDALVSVILPNPGFRARALTLYSNFLKYKREHPGTQLARERILEILVEEPAPEFFLDEETIRQILQNEVLKQRTKWHER